MPGGTTLRIRPADLADSKDVHDQSERMTFIIDAIHNAILDGVPDLVVIEGFSYASKSSSIDQIYGLGWLVRQHLINDECVPFAIVPPATLKAFATGDGGCAKDAMGIAAMEHARLNFSKRLDECDAWWLRAAALDAYGFPVVPLPAKQRAVLGKVDWPVLADGLVGVA